VFGLPFAELIEREQKAEADFMSVGLTELLRIEFGMDYP